MNSTLSTIAGAPSLTSCFHPLSQIIRRCFVYLKLPLKCGKHNHVGFHTSLKGACLSLWKCIYPENVFVVQIFVFLWANIYNNKQCVPNCVDFGYFCVTKFSSQKYQTAGSKIFVMATVDGQNA